MPESILAKTLAETANALAYVASSLPPGARRDEAEAVVAHAHDVLEADGMMDWLVGEVMNDIPALHAPDTKNTGNARARPEADAAP